MRARITALVAATVAAASAAGAATWARRKRGGETRQTRDGREAATPARQGETPTHAATPRRVSAKPAPVPMPPDPVASAPGAATVDAVPGDTLTSLKGIGAVSAERLHSVGVTTFAQIAAWSDEDIESVATQIKVSAERIHREDWVGQARAASGS